MRTGFENKAGTTFDPDNLVVVYAEDMQAIADILNLPFRPKITSISNSSTPTPDADTCDQYVITALSGTATFGAPTGAPTQGQKLIIRVKDSGSIRTLAWNGIYRAGADLALPVATVASKTLYIGFVYNYTDTKWDLVAVVNNI